MRQPAALSTAADIRTDTPRGRRRGTRRNTALAYLMLAPAIAGLSVFVIWPLFRSLYLSFFQWSFYTDNVYVGLKNFLDVVSDSRFGASVLRGLIFTCMAVPLQLVIAFVFASLVRTVGPRLSGLMKVTIYIPTVVSMVVASIIFIVIYQYSGGLANWMVGLFGVESQAWLGNPKLALSALVVPAVWIGMGLTCLIMLSAVLDIPETYFEAARLDGCGWLRQQLYITLPSIKNLTLYLTITGITAALQQLEIPMVMTNGEPAGSTLLPNLFILQHFRSDPNVGFSVAAAFLLFMVIGLVSALVFRLLQSEKSMDS
jgi:ABC-type sugar transport system permease subunit